VSFSVSILALSVIAPQCHLSQRERLWHGGKPDFFARDSPARETGERSETERSYRGHPSLRPAYYLAKWEIKNVSSLEKPLRQGGGMRAAGELTSLRQKRPLRQVGEVGKYNIAILFIRHFAT
jgi:hypothetical protein